MILYFYLCLFFFFVFMATCYTYVSLAGTDVPRSRARVYWSVSYWSMTAIFLLAMFTRNLPGLE